MEDEPKYIHCMTLNYKCNQILVPPLMWFMVLVKYADMSDICINNHCEFIHMISNLDLSSPC